MAGAKGNHPFAWADPFLLEAQLGEEECMIRDTARVHVEAELAPRINSAFRSEHTNPAIFREMRQRSNGTAPSAKRRTPQANVRNTTTSALVSRRDPDVGSVSLWRATISPLPV
jgi:hypothetical protein